MEREHFNRSGEGGKTSQAPTETAQNKLEEVKRKTLETAEEAKQRGKERLERGKEHLEGQKERAAGQIEQISEVLGNTSSELSKRNQPSLAAYTGDLASKVDNLAKKFRELSLEDMLRETQEYARREPGVFVAGSVALGFALSRFFKASPHVESDSDNIIEEPSPVSESIGDYAPSYGAHGGQLESSYPAARSELSNEDEFKTQGADDLGKKGV